MKIINIITKYYSMLLIHPSFIKRSKLAFRKTFQGTGDLEPVNLWQESFSITHRYIAVKGCLNKPSKEFVIEDFMNTALL